ncbi:MAG: hypothetical protein HYW24_01930 [Candidatus Aenigmarchaeota archaeon]|nr:hypothetical protein [Candidatus Aenigmarchaeota archaeon]
MFRQYGISGLLLIIFAEVTMFLRLQPFVTWFTPMVWIGYILLIDSFVYMLKKSSYLMNKRFKLFMLSLLSINFWFLFEIVNKFSQFQGWYYVNLPESRITTFIMGTLSFATIVPAVLETSELVGALHLFRKKLNIRLPINGFIVAILFSIGIIFVLLPFVITSPWIWAFVWTGFILLIDPILYIFHDKKSILYQLKNRKFNVILSLFLAGYICGFLWEFWNYWAYTKWYYSIPVIESIKIFEIPAVGFLAYGPFALELYVMYEFVKILVSRKMFGRIGQLKV